MDARIERLLKLLWAADPRDAGLIVVHLPSDLREEAFLVVCLGDDLIEVIRPNYSHSGTNLIIEKGFGRADWRRQDRKSALELIAEVLTEQVPDEIRHRVKLGRAGENRAARLMVSLSPAADKLRDALNDLRGDCDQLLVWLRIGKRSPEHILPETAEQIRLKLGDFWQSWDTAAAALECLPPDARQRLDNLDRPGWVDRVRRTLNKLADWPFLGYESAGERCMDPHVCAGKLQWGFPDWLPPFTEIGEAQLDLFALRDDSTASTGKSDGTAVAAMPTKIHFTIQPQITVQPPTVVVNNQITAPDKAEPEFVRWRTSDLAGELETTDQTIRNWIKSAILVGKQDGHGYVLVTAESVERQKQAKARRKRDKSVTSAKSPPDLRSQAGPKRSASGS